MIPIRCLLSTRDVSKGSIKTKEEIEVMKEGGRKLAGVLARVVERVQPGVTTLELDLYAERLIREAGGEPAFKGYRAFGAKAAYPATMCISINDEVVHAIPKKERELKEGDIVGLDIGMRWPISSESGIRNQESGKSNDSGYKFQDSGVRAMVTDMAVTVGVGKISPKAEALLRVTRESLEKGIARVRPGARLGDIGAAIQAHIEEHGFGVVRDLAGHGVGYQLHEDPLIPNFGKAGEGGVLREGMVIAIEPMATEGSPKVTIDSDEWTFRTKDGGLAAHFEHTVVVAEDGGLIVTKE